MHALDWSLSTLQVITRSLAQLKVRFSAPTGAALLQMAVDPRTRNLLCIIRMQETLEFLWNDVPAAKKFQQASLKAAAREQFESFQTDVPDEEDTTHLEERTDRDADASTVGSRVTMDKVEAELAKWKMQKFTTKLLSFFKLSANAGQSSIGFGG